MEDIKRIISKNISDLRLSNEFTQSELAKKLNYTDKAVSKWERGESIPDISVLKAIADIFGVTVDYLLEEEHKEKEAVPDPKTLFHSRIAVTGMSVMLVWLLATLAFVVVDLMPQNMHAHWLSFIFAVPVSLVVMLIFNSIWFNQRRNYIIISFLMWTVIAAIYLTFLAFGNNIWLIFVLCIPGQIIILFWSGIHPKNAKNIFIGKSRKSENQ